MKTTTMDHAQVVTHTDTSMYSRYMEVILKNVSLLKAFFIAPLAHL